jgi:hypothetical protein
MALLGKLLVVQTLSVGRHVGIKLSLVANPNPRIAELAKHTLHFFVGRLTGVLFARSGFFKCEFGAYHGWITFASCVRFRKFPPRLFNYESRERLDDS